MFRKDLYFRLCAVSLMLPPLRERPEDIELLIKHFMAYFADYYRIKTPVLSKEVYEKLQRHPWEGNVRELRNLCERLAIQKIRRVIKLNDLPIEYQEVAAVSAPLGIYKLPKSGIDLQELEVCLIKQALAKAGEDNAKAARLLGLSLDTLKYRRKKFFL